MGEIELRVGRRNQHGIVSIELAIGALLFIFIILTYFELARYVFINNMISVWNYDIARDTRVWHEKQSDQARADNMKQLLQKRWQPVLLNSNIDVSIKYFADFSALQNDKKGGCDAQDCKYMEFVTTYEYTPMFPSFWFVPDGKTIGSRILVEREWLYEEKNG